MEIVGKPEITNQMISILKRELSESLEIEKAELKDFKESRTQLRKNELSTETIDIKIRKQQSIISQIENELKYYSVKYEPIRIFDIVINHKLLKKIIQKTKKLNVSFEKVDNDKVIVSWNGKGTKGKFTLNNLAQFYQNIIYIPELVIQE